MWVTNNSSNNVTKIRASDGAVLGTFPAGTSPAGIAFDGVHMWIANQDKQSVTKMLRLMVRFGSARVGFSPFAVTFDGANIWVANLGDSSVTKVRARDGAVLGTFTWDQVLKVLLLTEPISGSATAAITQ